MLLYNIYKKTEFDCSFVTSKTKYLRRDPALQAYSYRKANKNSKADWVITKTLVYIFFQSLCISQFFTYHTLVKNS